MWWAQLIAVLLTAGIFCYFLARYLSSPVVKLRAATQQLAGGDLSARVGAANSRRRDELADLGRDFDAMAERIESLMAVITTATASRHITRVALAARAVEGDEQLLRSAIENVVRNAVSYTAEGTTVEVSLRRQDDDDGAGLSSACWIRGRESLKQRWQRYSALFIE